MSTMIKNAQITHVSYVDKGANKKTFFLTKSEEKPNLEKYVDVFINKNEVDQQLVYGIVYEPNILDAHDEYMTADEIEKSAHYFMKEARNIDTNHDFDSGVGEVVESYIAPADFEIGNQEVKKGSWVLVTKATDEVWEGIKNGDITGYSMAGKAEKVKKSKVDQSENSLNVMKDDENNELKGFFNLLKNFFTKGEVRDRYESNRKRRSLFAVWSALDDVFHSAVFNANIADVADFERIESATNEFLEIIGEIKDSGDIQKALNEVSKEYKAKGDNEMKKEDVEKLIDEKLEGINKKLDEIEKDDSVEDDAENVKKDDSEDQDVTDVVSKALDEKLEPIAKRLEAIEKTRGTSNQGDTDKSDVKKTRSVFEGLL